MAQFAQLSIYQRCMNVSNGIMFHEFLELTLFLFSLRIQRERKMKWKKNSKRADIWSEQPEKYGTLLDTTRYSVEWDCIIGLRFVSVLNKNHHYHNDWLEKSKIISATIHQITNSNKFELRRKNMCVFFSSPQLKRRSRSVQPGNLALLIFFSRSLTLFLFATFYVFLQIDMWKKMSIRITIEYKRYHGYCTEIVAILARALISTRFGCSKCCLQKPTSSISKLNTYIYFIFPSHSHILFLVHFSIHIKWGSFKIYGLNTVHFISRIQIRSCW